MSTTKLTRSEQKRLDIINAAKKIFKEQGAAATSMDKLAEAANVSKRTVYNHFASKEALIAYLVAELWQQAMVNVDIKFDSTQSLHPVLTSILLKEIELMSSEQYIDLSRVAFGHLFFNPSELQRIAEQFSSVETVLIRWIKEASANNKLNCANIEKAGEQLHHLIKGECFWPQLLQIKPLLSSVAMKQLADDTASLFLSHYEIKQK